MSTVLPHHLGLYYPSKDLQNAGDDLPERTVAATGSTTLQVIANDLPGNVNWSGAVGFFHHTSAGSRANLALPFHVRQWDSDTKTLHLAAMLPVAPQPGDKFRVFAGGKIQSSQEVLAMQIDGKQPELDTITHSTLPGVTIKKASAMLGTGTLRLRCIRSATELSLAISMIGTNAIDYGPSVAVTNSLSNVAIYDRDHAGFIIVDIGTLPATNGTHTATYTVTAPKGNLIPNYQGYETNDGVGRTRYHLVVAKNNTPDPNTFMNAFAIWTGRPAGTVARCTATFAPQFAGPQAITVDATASAAWPTRGFWVRNRTVGDFRYVDFRSGNTLHVKAIHWGMCNFTAGSTRLQRGATITNAASGGTITAVIDQVNLTAGSLAAGTGEGTLLLKRFTGTTAFGSNAALFVDGVQACTAGTTTHRGYRGAASGTSWTNAHDIELASDLDVGLQRPESGEYLDPPDEYTAPNGVIFRHCPSQDQAEIAGPVFKDATVGIWMRQTILDGMQSRQEIEGDLSTMWS